MRCASIVLTSGHSGRGVDSSGLAELTNGIRNSRCEEFPSPPGPSPRLLGGRSRFGVQWFPGLASSTVAVGPEGRTTALGLVAAPRGRLPPSIPPSLIGRRSRLLRRSSLGGPPCSHGLMELCPALRASNSSARIERRWRLGARPTKRGLKGNQSRPSTRLVRPVGYFFNRPSSSRMWLLAVSRIKV